MITHPAGPSRGSGDATRPDLRHLEKVRGIFASLTRFVNAQAIYQPNNPHFIKAAQMFEQSFRSYFEGETELVLTVLQYQILWRDQVVYDIGCNTESIAFLLYKDGVGEITVQAAVARGELEQLTGIIKGALYNPSAQFDTATALWQAEFPNIFYRVLDEQADGQSPDGDGSGGSGQENPLRANDHQDLSGGATQSGARHAADSALTALGAYFESLAGPPADAGREQRLQQLLDEHLSIAPEEAVGWTSDPRAGHDGDELLVFLRVMLEFTSMRLPPPVIRDVNDTIERLVNYVRDEGHIATLTSTLEIVAGIQPDHLEAGFEAVPDRIEAALTEGEFLVSLARGMRAGNDPHDVLRYLSLAGDAAVHAVCELLARSTDDAIHEKGCDVLHACAGDTLADIVERLDVENPCLAADAVRLLLRGRPAGVPSVIQRILASADAEVRRCSIDYLARVGTDESAQLLCGLFHDPALAVRTRAFASVDQYAHPLVTGCLTSLCFVSDATPRTPEELEQMFRALGKAAGISVLPQIRHVIGKKHYLPAAKAQGKRDRLLAITALKYIPGDDARSILEGLSGDADPLVKTKAQHVLKGRTSGVDSDADYPALAGAPATGAKP